MNFALSTEQHMMIDTVRRFIQNELAPLEEAVEEAGELPLEIARRLFEKSKALGLYATNIPEEFGGGGLSAVDTMLIEEQFGHTTDILIRRAFGNVYEILLSCQGEQIERWLLPAVRGDRVCSIAITESGAGSDAAGIATRATPTDSVPPPPELVEGIGGLRQAQPTGSERLRSTDGKSNGWRLTGSKHFISDGLFSDFYVVSAVTDAVIDPVAGSRGISMFLVDKEMPGVTVGKDQKMMGLRGTPHVELFFDNVELGPEHLLGEEGCGLRLVLELLGRVRLAQVGARAVGKACHVLTMMVDYAKTREQFGQPIGEFQLVQQMLADSAIEINAARLLVLKAAYEIDQGNDAKELISMVKVHAAEMLGRVVDRGVQLFGGMGFCKELPIERYYRDARIYRIFDGTSEIHRTVVARGLLRKGASLYDIGA